VTALELLQTVIKRGVAVQVRGTEVILDGPVQVLTDDLVAKLRASKSTLLAALAGRKPAWDATDWHAYFDERAAVRQYDGALSREAAPTFCRFYAGEA
jgi:hypothetical protein